jgi:hypothetical protein
MKRVAVLRTILALNVIVTAAAMALAYRALRHADDSERLVIRSHQTLQAAEETLRRVVDAETSERAYLLTGDAKDLEAFAAMMVLVGAPMETLTAILREDGRGTDAERLRAHVGLTLAAYERVVEHRRASGSIDSAGRDGRRARDDRHDSSDRDRPAGRADPRRRQRRSLGQLARDRDDGARHGADDDAGGGAGVSGAAGSLALGDRKKGRASFDARP